MSRARSDQAWFGRTAEASPRSERTPAFPCLRHSCQHRSALNAQAKRKTDGHAALALRCRAPAAAGLAPRLGLLEALEVVVGNRLPWSGVRDEGAPARAHARIAIERPEPDAHLPWVVRVATEEVRSAFAAEALLETTLGMAPCPDQCLALEQPERATVDPRLRRCRGPGPPLAASAVTVAGVGGRLAQLEADASTQTSSGDGRLHRFP